MHRRSCFINSVLRTTFLPITFCASSMRYLTLQARRVLAKHYSPLGPSVDPELMLMMLLVGYAYGIRSESF